MTGSTGTSEKTDKIGKSPNVRIPNKENANRPKLRLIRRYDNHNTEFSVKHDATSSTRTPNL